MDRNHFKKMYRMTVGKLAWESWTWLAQHGFVLKARSGTRDRDNDALGTLAGFAPDHGQHSVVSQKLYRNGRKDRKGNTED
jgi:hypothetical protein